MKMNILEIIAKKRDKKELSQEEINFFVENYTNGQLMDSLVASKIPLTLYAQWQ